MNLQQYAAFQNLQHYRPIPWYIDQSNASGVCVKDLRGNVVFYEDFGSIPDEMPSHQADDIRSAAMALAIWLVAQSEESVD